MSRRRPRVTWLTAMLLIAMGPVQAGCARGDTTAQDGHDAVAAAEARAMPDGSYWLPSIATVPHQLDASTRVFDVAARTPSLRQFPCASCHRPDGPAPRPARPDRPERAHWRVVDAHGSASGFTCASCHDPREPQRLRDVHGQEVAVDHSYRLCGACHFQQLSDWEGGAHGKRLAIWSGPRVVEPCTGCHDPHRPGVEVRTPAAHSPLPVRGRAR